uniref:Putative secreted protein n=1 Tax=Amblyomma triste TaxID=251400 RepID=A0A023G3V2_AMBTT
MKPVVLLMISLVLFGVLVDAFHIGQSRPHSAQPSHFVRNTVCSHVCDLNKRGHRCGSGCKCVPSTIGAPGLGICRPTSGPSHQGPNRSRHPI